MTMFNTIIIGAGIAGLSAANYLFHHSHEDFIILESFGKTGGRVQTIEFSDKTFPTGPGWVHGKNGNPIFDILSDLNVSLELADIMKPDAVYVWDTTEGKDVSKMYNERRHILNDLIEDITKNLSDQNIESEKSFLEILSEHSNFFCNMSDFDKTVLFSTLEIYMGSPLDDVSGLTELQNDETYELDEDIVNYRILDPLGVPKLINHLRKGFEDKIHLNCKAKSIEWDNDSGYVIITLVDGRQFTCKNVIITVQSGLLAKGSIGFQPSLPVEKISAWDHAPAVNYCRVFAKFPRKFWPDNEWFLPILENVDPVNELLFWQNCSSQHLCSEEDNILICHYTSGWKNKSCRFDVDKESLIELVAEAMKNIFPESYCDPIDVLFSSHWDSDRFAGAFSTPAPGMDKSSMIQLQKSVGPLRFAGESVIAGFMGTMQAAYMSGENAAKDILE